MPFAVEPIDGDGAGTTRHPTHPATQGGFPPARGPVAAAVWWPYRPIADALLNSHRSAGALRAANRELSDAVHAILRREQDLMVEIAEPAAVPDAAAHVDRRFDAAVAAVRELNRAVLEAQLRSLEVMRREALQTVAGPRRSD